MQPRKNQGLFGKGLSMHAFENIEIKEKYMYMTLAFHASLYSFM